ncbi:MAG: hypothetical protein JXR56_05530 [Candidatus Cloacimonetes bacterium]|nr:hypothetical protein [Candidatus Cloacimonadota bacterium]
MRCKHCNNNLQPTQIWCESCGHQTELLKKELSVRTLIKEIIPRYKENINNNYGIGFLLAYAVLLPILALVFMHSEVSLTGRSFIDYLIYNLLFIIITPFAFLPFYIFEKQENGRVSIKDYISVLKYYPAMLMFAFANFLFYFAVKYICIGDPILNLVRVVLVLYWPAIVLPVPFLVSKTGQNPFKVIYKCYKKLGDVRWKFFFIWTFLLLVNFLGLVPAGLGLLVTLPFTYTFISAYMRKIITYNLID